MYLGLRQVCIAVRDLEPAIRTLSTLFDVECCLRDDLHVARHGLRNAVVPFGSSFIELIAPAREGTAVGRYLEHAGGDRGYMLILETDDFDGWKDHLAAVDAVVVRESADGSYHFRQIHPKSVGGVLLSIDADGTPGDGCWLPAGPNWKSCARTARVSGIGGVQLQSPAPHRLAVRWGQVLDRAVKKTAEARSIELSDATDIAFGPGPSDAGEFMTKVKLRGVNVGACLAAATTLGLKVTNDSIDALGMRFDLEARHGRAENAL
ncbi:MULTISPECIES: VOC family protein [unclassified Bradyrhizobium]|jgi:hypothetical protein|uniref:VOC family protein n=1 Tax=unclassified Bradyrhizobium TaxID=2631580 RepID=UPI00143CFC5D|nr:MULTISPECIES: VOC family protein [unclassified Bradyrhizobium]